MDTSDDSDSDWDAGETLVAQAIIGFEEGKYRVQWEGEGDSTLESPTFALAGCHDLVDAFWLQHRAQCDGCAVCSPVGEDVPTVVDTAGGAGVGCTTVFQ